MKMKKFAVLLLTGGVIAGLFAGCGGKSQQEISGQQEGTASVAGETVASSGIMQESSAESSDVSGTVQSAPEASSVQDDQQGQVSGMEEAPAASFMRIWGPVLSVGENSITIDNRSECGVRGEIVLLVDPENTRLLDGENGYPEELSELEVDDPVFAYIGQTMTLSIPAQVNAELIFCDIPDDLRVPEYVRVTQMEQQSDGSYLMTVEGQMQYLVPENCEILPYLTRNLVTLADVQSDSTCLVWCDEKLTAKKIVLFAQ